MNSSKLFKSENNELYISRTRERVPLNKDGTAVLQRNSVSSGLVALSAAKLFLKIW